VKPANNPEPVPLALAAAARRALREIERGDYEWDEALMLALMRAAWPTPLAQDQ
jgi:hypothetical protein